MQRFAITPLAALGILAGAVPAARAADTPCTGPITGTTINGNLTVPAGATCTLTNVTVTGNVQVGKGASLTTPALPGNTVTIGGNVQATQCQTVSIIPPSETVSVGGNVQIQYCTSESGFDTGGQGTVTISGNFVCDHNSGVCSAAGGSVRGNVEVNNNSGGSIGNPGAEVGGNTVGGNVQVNNNSGNFVSQVFGNTIGGNLQCAGNTPGVSDFGLPNTVAGNKQGQCAGANF
jgi:hypothetical protein